MAGFETYAASSLLQVGYDLICYAALFWGNGAAWIIWRYIESVSTAATLAGPVRMEIWSVSHVSFTVFGSSLLLLIFFGLDCLGDVLTRLFKGKADKPHG